VTPHAARATFITEALEKEHPAEAVQRTVGHAHISTTLAYDKREDHPRKSASFAVGY
jgi:integrase